jgi:hypothetical protein
VAQVVDQVVIMAAFQEHQVKEHQVAMATMAVVGQVVEVEVQAIQVQTPALTVEVQVAVVHHLQLPVQL